MRVPKSKMAESFAAGRSGFALAAAFAAALSASHCAEGAINSRSYVRRGLVAQYDGIDNAGFGVHDGSAATWVDLTIVR